MVCNVSGARAHYIEYVTAWGSAIFMTIYVCAVLLGLILREGAIWKLSVMGGCGEKLGSISLLKTSVASSAFVGSV